MEKRFVPVSYIDNDNGIFVLIKKGNKKLKELKCFFNTGYAYSYDPLEQDELELIDIEGFEYKGITEHSAKNKKHSK